MSDASLISETKIIFHGDELKRLPLNLLPVDSKGQSKKYQSKVDWSKMKVFWGNKHIYLNYDFL